MEAEGQKWKRKTKIKLQKRLLKKKISKVVTLIAENRKARFDYEVLEKFEAGIVLTGSEVKSVRNRQVQLKDSYVVVIGDEVFLQNAHISEYKAGSYNNHYPERVRKLLLNRVEINKIIGKIQERGFSCVPLKVYFKGGVAKIEIALAKGKKDHDKRHDIRERESKRELERLRRK